MKSFNERRQAIGNTWRAVWVKVSSATPAVALVGVLMLGSGCAHTLDVKNMGSYQTTQTHPLQKSVSIGLVSLTNSPDSQQLMKGIGTALGKYTPTVIQFYGPESATKVDVIANINIQSEYKGSGWNFLINFPGFLIFTPAWNGYVYKANYNVDIALAKGADHSKLDTWSVPINLDLRQAEIDRTWTEISWLEVGAIAFIGGIVFTGYDTDVTQPLVEKIQNPIGDYIAQDIVNHINNNGNLTVSVPSATAPTSATPPVETTPVAPAAPAEAH